MQSIGKINIEDGIRTIEVNDRGEYISLSINDSTLMDKLLTMMDFFKKTSHELDTYAAGLEEREDYLIKEGTTENDPDMNMDLMHEIARKRVELCKRTCDQIDALFGEGSCRKIFGDIIPNENAITSFIEQLMPCIEKIINERGDRINKRYDRRRKGFRGMVKHG